MSVVPAALVLCVPMVAALIAPGTVSTRAPEVEKFPAVSVDLAVMLWSPGVLIALVVMPGLAYWAAVPLPICVTPSRIVTVVPASAVPVNVFVPAAMMPSGSVRTGLSAGMEGAAGAIVSIVTLKAAEAVEVLPTRSVCFAEML